MSSLSVFVGVPKIIESVPLAAVLSGPLPRTKAIQLLLVPGTVSAIPSPTGIMPTFVLAGHAGQAAGSRLGAEQLSNDPLASARVITIEGVAPKPTGFVNGPSVALSGAESPELN